MPLSEADTRAKLIDPSLYTRGWQADNIKRKETPENLRKDSRMLNP